MNCIFPLFLLVNIFQLIRCRDEAKILAIAKQLSSDFPEQLSNEDTKIEDLRKINELVLDSSQPLKQRLLEIREIGYNFMKWKLKKELDEHNEQILNARVLNFAAAMNRNDQFSARLHLSQVSDEVRSLNEDIQGLYSRLSFYRNGRNYAGNAIVTVLCRASEVEFLGWSSLWSEIYENLSYDQTYLEMKELVENSKRSGRIICPIIEQADCPSKELSRESPCPEPTPCPIPEPCEKCPEPIQCPSHDAPEKLLSKQSEAADAYPTLSSLVTSTQPTKRSVITTTEFDIERIFVSKRKGSQSPKKTDSYEERVRKLSDELASKYPENSTVIDEDVDTIRRINEIIRSNGKTATKKLESIKEYAISLTRNQIRENIEIKDEDIWNEERINHMISLINQNDRFIKKISRPDVSDEVRELDDLINELSSQLSMYTNGRYYASEQYRLVLSKASETAFTTWEKFHNEVFGKSLAEKKNKEAESPKSLIIRNSLIAYYALKFRDRVAEIPILEIVYENAKYNISFNGDITMEERYSLIKAEFYAKLRSEPWKAHATDEELFSEWIPELKKVDELAAQHEKIIERFAKTNISDRVRNLHHAFLNAQLSHQLYEADEDEAIEIFRLAAQDYTNEELLIWELTYEGSKYTKFPIRVKQRIQIIDEMAHLYHQEESKWSSKYGAAVYKRRIIECDFEKSDREKMRILKPINIELYQAISNRRLNPNEAEQYWEDIQKVQKSRIEECDGFMRSFSNYYVRTLNTLFHQGHLTDDFSQASLEEKKKILTEVVDGVVDHEVIEWWDSLHKYKEKFLLSFV